jgi:hypothetical protein
VTTKLKAYLRRAKISHRAFAEQAGIPHLHPMISQWADAPRTNRWPGLAAAVGMERASGGKIPAAYWFDLRNRLQARGVVPRSARSVARDLPDNGS